MSTPNTLPSLHQTRDRVVAAVRELRRARGLTQAELGRLLGLSQARVSEIEGGGGSFTAEQLIAVLTLFNVDIAQFLPPSNEDDALQNALIQHGATHLRQVPGVASSGRFSAPSQAILAVLLTPRSARFVTALGPVLLRHIDAVSLPALRARLAETGRPARLGWLIQNVRDALLLPPPTKDAELRRLVSRAILVLDNELDTFPAPTPQAPIDVLDPTLRSKESLDLVWNEQASPISRRWRIATDIQPDDLRAAIWEAYEPR